jgi:enoyl-CoA hydratase/carnithine racemase
MVSTFDPATDGRVTTELRDRVWLIGLDRPKKLNGLSLKMLRELAEAFTALENDADAWVGLLFAHGDHFTAGLQLDQVGAHMAAGNPIYPPGLVDPMNTRAPLRTKPVVCAVQGICLTAGIEIMLAADVVVAADDCRFAQIEVKRGIMPTGGATMRFVERAGWGNAQRYLLTGDEFNAHEAWRLGFVQEVVAKGQQLTRALAIAQSIAACAPLAVRASLASSRKFADHGPIAAVAEMDAVQQRLSATEDAKEGVRAFIEKRAARFTGR